MTNFKEITRDEALKLPTEEVFKGKTLHIFSDEVFVVIVTGRFEGLICDGVKPSQGHANLSAFTDPKDRFFLSSGYPSRREIRLELVDRIKSEQKGFAFIPNTHCVPEGMAYRRESKYGEYVAWMPENHPDMEWRKKGSSLWENMTLEQFKA